MNSIEAFLNKTESQSDGGVTVQPRYTIEYPYLYVNNFTIPEVSHLKSSGVIHFERESEDDVLFLCPIGNGKLQILGYVTLSIRTLVTINALTEHTIMLKRSKTSEINVVDGIVDMLLLKE